MASAREMMDAMTTAQLAPAAQFAPATTHAAAGANVELRGVTVGYGGPPVLEQIDLQIPRGAFTALIGGNGSGKSTLLKTILGSLQPSRGEVLIDGRPPRRVRSRIGYMPQASAVDWHFPVTVREVVEMGRYRFGWKHRIRRGPIADPNDAVGAALDTMEIAHLARREIAELSGGQQKRVLIARALAREPDLLLLDEPAASLDAVADDDLVDTLCDVAAGGATVVIATHDLASVVDHYAHVVCLCQAVIAVGRPREVFTEDILRRTFGRELAIVSRVAPGTTPPDHTAPLAGELRFHFGDDHDHPQGHPHGEDHEAAAAVDCGCCVPQGHPHGGG